MVSKKKLTQINFFYNCDQGHYDSTNTPENEELGTVFYIKNKKWGYEDGFYEIQHGDCGLHLRKITNISPWEKYNSIPLLSAIQPNIMMQPAWRYAKEWEHIYAI